MDLTSFKKMRWENVAVMHGTDVSTALGSDKRLPGLILPQFPLLSFADSNVIYFQLNERDRTWLVEVDMKKKALGAVTLYRNDEEPDHRNRTVSSFIPFTRYLTEHHPKSLELTSKLERA
jgi:hypothetical protein